MPKLKQPESLKDTSMKFLVIFFGDYFHKHSTEGSLSKIRQCVAVIKEDICPGMSWKLEAEFCYKLIKAFLWPCDGPIERPKPHIRAVAEVLMDRKIIGLECSYRLLDLLEPDDTRRIRGLKELHLGSKVPHILTNFHLEDITKLVYRRNCTDSDLKIIGQNCRKLLHLDVSESRKVTDVGLRALRGCPDLHFVHAAACSVSESGLIDFLSANKRIRELKGRGILDWSSLPDSSVYPSMESLEDLHYSCPNGGLRFVTDKFPNLKSLIVWCDNAGHLEELKYLRRLSHLVIGGRDIFCLNEKMADIFRFIGANLLTLGLGRVITRQRDVDLVFHFCGNLEHLEFFYRPGTVRKLVIPTHRNLKKLESYRFYDSENVVQFGKMPKLEELTLKGFHISLDEIVFDQTNFPELKKVWVPKEDNRDGKPISQIREIARAKNLDLELVEICYDSENYV